MSIKPEFIVVCRERDWEFDGFQIFPKRVISGVRDGRYEACGNRIIRGNQALSRVKLPVWIGECESMLDVLYSIHRKDIWPIVEALWNDNQKDVFYIGPITKFGERSFWLRCYDADGRWEKRFEIDYSEIFRIEIESRYARHFNNYMKSKS